jgi:23S rRNA (guanosine2251-2'-O)-methyltransferase
MKEVIYGIHPVAEALKARETRVKEILIARSRRGNVGRILHLAVQQGVRVRYRESNALQTLSKGKPHQGVVALIEGRTYATLEDIIDRWKESSTSALILALDLLQDPQNLGALIRTANACGVHGVIIPKNRATGITPTVVKASAGATAFTPVARVTNMARTLERLKEEGVWIIGTAGEAGTPLFNQDLTGDLAVVIGSEGRGIRPLVRRVCDLTVSIPLRGEIPSLNASVAGGIVLYEAIRQRLMKTSVGKNQVDCRRPSRSNNHP